LQRAFGLLTPAEVEQHVTKRMIHCKPGKTSIALAGFLWKRIFTWNIDDVLENTYKAQTTRQEIKPIHYNDEFIEFRTLAELMIVHMHGTVLTPDKGYVFSRDQYLGLINNLNPWMVVLSQFMLSEPMIIAGTAMDEVDLDYYLAHRTTVTSRDDRGPSIFVTKDDDAVTQQYCEKHNLLLFVGWAGDFFEYCKAVLPHPPTPEELIPLQTKKLIPAGVSKGAAVAFGANFELVPSAANPNEDTRFLYGYPPTWADLAGGLDVSRPIVAELVVDIETRLEKTTEPRLVLISESAGTGKTTILRRIGFELAKRGKAVLLCSTLGRLDKSAASVIDLMDGPLVFIVDDFGDQVTAIPDLMDQMEKKDVVFVAAERGYREGHIRQLLSTIPFDTIDNLPLAIVEAERLIDSYSNHGLLGDHTAIKHRHSFAQKVVGDPIAVACCRIMNDFKPLERIVEDVIGDASEKELDRYLLAAIGQVCFHAGVRYEILISALDAKNIKDQFEKTNPLPLAYSDPQKTFVVPQNATMAERILSRAVTKDRKRLLEVFVALATEVRPRVNRQAIKWKSPEARLSGRLFDYDDVTSKFLGDNSERFYAMTRDVWQWNSRYWEQVSLLNLAKFRRDPDSNQGIDALENSVQHARHAVAIELHPHGLTTLGKVLMAQMQTSDSSMTSIYGEAFDKLVQAIDMEASWSRTAIQPFMSLFSGTTKFLEMKGVLTTKQRDRLNSLVNTAEDRSRRDPQVLDMIAAFRKLMKGT
jgi:hypothetical protein